MTSEWHVEYRIEVDAESAEDAARQVATMLANGGAERGVYQVSLHSDVLQHPVIEIDLDEGSFEDGDRECSRCGEEVSILNSQDECLGCEEERATRAALEREGRESVRKGTALAAALAELDRDGYVHVAHGGRFRPQGIRSDKRLYSPATINALGEFIQLDRTTYATYGRVT